VAKKKPVVATETFLMVGLMEAVRLCDKCREPIPLHKIAVLQQVRDGELILFHLDCHSPALPGELQWDDKQEEFEDAPE
jgi:hypothetical protein